MNITTVSFDGDMTLWDFQAVMENALQKTLHELWQYISTNKARHLTVQDLIATRNHVAEQVKTQIKNLEQIRLLAFKETLKNIGHENDTLANHLHQKYMTYRFEDMVPYNDVIPMLDRLSGHVQLGFISNGNSDPERCGLKDRFDFVIMAQDVGVQKPDKKIFEIAASQANFKLENLLHVGDSLDDDVVGANHAGAKSVWLNREGQTNPSHIKPDYQITSLLEIPKILNIPNTNQ